MDKTEQETHFSEETIKFRPHTAYKFFGPFNRPRRLLKGWHLFPFHPIYYDTCNWKFYSGFACDVMKAHGEVDARVHTFVSTALERGREASPTLSRLYPGPRNSFYGRLNVTQRRSGHEGVKKDLLSSAARDRTRAVQPVAKPLPLKSPLK